ncbi:DUF6777 domain-containing protein [Streptomyces sp. NPDC058646]|uniref:DUF6777 domain-containing protein n=1 Tax=Streptomyces sp. NPDC058646 TaxID=3346574 RepID=UPI00365E8B61
MAVLALFAAGCGGSEETVGAAGSESQEVYLEPVAAAGPAPFTASSATRESAPVQLPLPNPTGRGIRTVNAATPGLYGGTQRLGSCDVEQQVRYLTADEAKARAFAEASGIEAAKISDFLRGLTPVVLRADTRVTSHGFRGGAADGFQAVLQAGTAVLVDDHGMPRVRCACGNPLQSPRAGKGSPVHKGDPWSGYRPNQVIVIEPTPHVIDNLVIVNIADNTWIERKTGDDGAQDRTPRVVPPYDPANGIPNADPGGTTPADPCLTTGPTRTAPPTEPGRRSAPGTAAAPGPLPPAPRPTDCPPEPGTGREGLPDRPLNPAEPQKPPNSVPSDGTSDFPAEPDLQGDPMAPDAFDPEAPYDPNAQGEPMAPDFPQEPDGTAPAPDDPFDPNTVPDPQLDPSDAGSSLESA